MGSMIKRSKVPTRQPVSPNTAFVAVPSVEAEKAEPMEEEIAASSRKKSLLRRSRGRFGTILTGFNGFLNPASSGESSSRKTLLGE